MGGQTATHTSKDKNTGRTEERSQASARQVAGSSPHADVLDLQHAAGNRAVSELVQSSHTASRGNDVPPIVRSVLNSSGQPLDPATRAFMEPRFGRDFSQVRVHTDAKAAESARAVDARAYTVGRDVVFSKGGYTPHFRQGSKLLAHELAHVIQQERGGPSPPPLHGGMLEQGADAAASAFVAGRGPIHVGGASAPGLARQPVAGEKKSGTEISNDDELADNIDKHPAWGVWTGGQGTVEEYSEIEQNVAGAEGSFYMSKLFRDWYFVGWRAIRAYPDPGTSLEILALWLISDAEREAFFKSVGIVGKIKGSTAIMEGQRRVSDEPEERIQQRVTAIATSTEDYSNTNIEEMSRGRGTFEGGFGCRAFRRFIHEGREISKSEASKKMVGQIVRQEDLPFFYAPSERFVVMTKTIVFDTGIQFRDELWQILPDDPRDAELALGVIRGLEAAPYEGLGGRLGSGIGRGGVRGLNQPNVPRLPKVVQQKPVAPVTPAAPAKATVPVKPAVPEATGRTRKVRPGGGQAYRRPPPKFKGGGRPAPSSAKALRSGIAVPQKNRGGGRGTNRPASVSKGGQTPIGAEPKAKPPKSAPQKTAPIPKPKPAPKRATPAPPKPAPKKGATDITKQKPLSPDEAFGSLKKELEAAPQGTGRGAGQQPGKTQPAPKTTPPTAKPTKTRNEYPDFEDTPPGLRKTAEKQTQRLSSQLGIRIRKDRVLSAPWIGRIRGKGGKARSTGTSQGWLRNEKRFWDKWKKSYPADAKLLGPGNTVTPALAKKYGWPDSGPNNTVGQKLVHHHMENGTLTVAIPESVHQKLSGKIHAKPTVVGE